MNRSLVKDLLLIYMRTGISKRLDSVVALSVEIDLSIISTR